MSAIIVTVVAVAFAFKANELKYEQISFEQLENVGVQNLIGALSEPNVYFIMMDSSIVLYSNLQKSGMYTYPKAKIGMKDNKLKIDITTDKDPTVSSVKEGLFVKLYMDKLPDQINITFMGQKISKYEIIND